MVMVRRGKSPKSTRKNKKTLKAKKNSHKGMRKNKKTRRNVKKHRRYGGAPPTDEKEMPPTDEKEMPQKVEEEECAICQEIHDDDVIIKTNCGHTFHKKCLGLWCNTRTSDADKTCPICRANIAALCQEIKPLNSLGIMSHLEAMFFDIPGYAGVDVESRRIENYRIIHEYLDNPAFDPNVYDSHNRTPLYLAVERSRDDVIDKLLKRPDINTEIRETHSGKTPLELAITNRNYRAIALFKKHKKIPKALKGLV
jgi:hypothetical protein